MKKVIVAVTLALVSMAATADVVRCSKDWKGDIVCKRSPY